MDSQIPSQANQRTHCKLLGLLALLHQVQCCACLAGGA
jgi:hypothetical protein